jgi:hypothetical protein
MTVEEQIKMAKMNPKFKKAIIFSILAVALISIFDILAAHSGVFGSLEDYTNGNFVNGWWSLFFVMNMIMLAIGPVIYYFSVRKDKSEKISLFLTSVILWFTGLADILYFLFQFKMIPAKLPWLNHGIYKVISSAMGLNTITWISLLITTALGFVAIYFLNKIMEKIN